MSRDSYGYLWSQGCPLVNTKLTPCREDGCQRKIEGPGWMACREP